MDYLITNKTKFIPFIFLSAKTEHKDIRKGMELGADDYLTKPFEEIELINAIESRIAKAAILQEHQKDMAAINTNFNFQEDALKNLDDLRGFFEKEGDYQEFESGEEIYSETTNSNYLYLVEQGVVKNHRLDEYGKELITGPF
jgi:DNA-binding response OmpR family regulator